MKAKSIILKNLQPPDTIYGVPPRFLSIALCGGLLAYLTFDFIAVDLFSQRFQALASMIPLGIFIITAIIFIIFGLNKNRRDCHFIHIYLCRRKFWRNKPRNKRVCLLAGEVK